MAVVPSAVLPKKLPSPKRSEKRAIRVSAGRIIVQDLERIAGAAGISRLVLLTQSATQFFQRLGYQVIERKEVPRQLQASEEFRSLCPASATCMAKTLAQPSS